VGVGAVVGGAAAAGGTGVVVTLTLLAMGEWKTISEDELYGDELDGDGDDGGPDDPHDGVSSRNPSA